MRLRSDAEIDELLQLARSYCEARASLRQAETEDRLSPEQRHKRLFHLGLLDKSLQLLKSNNELERMRWRALDKVVPLTGLRAAR